MLFNYVGLKGRTKHIYIFIRRRDINKVPIDTDNEKIIIIKV